MNKVIKSNLSMGTELKAMAVYCFGLENKKDILKHRPINPKTVNLDMAQHHKCDPLKKWSDFSLDNY